MDTQSQLKGLLIDKRAGQPATMASPVKSPVTSIGRYPNTKAGIPLIKSDEQMQKRWSDASLNAMRGGIDLMRSVASGPRDVDKFVGRTLLRSYMQSQMPQRTPTAGDQASLERLQNVANPKSWMRMGDRQFSVKQLPDLSGSMYIPWLQGINLDRRWTPDIAAHEFGHALAPRWYGNSRGLSTINQLSSVGDDIYRQASSRGFGHSLPVAAASTVLKLPILASELAASGIGASVMNKAGVPWSNPIGPFVGIPTYALDAAAPMAANLASRLPLPYSKILPDVSRLGR